LGGAAGLALGGAVAAGFASGRIQPILGETKAAFASRVAQVKEAVAGIVSGGNIEEAVAVVSAAPALVAVNEDVYTYSAGGGGASNQVEVPWEIQLANQNMLTDDMGFPI